MPENLFLFHQSRSKVVFKALNTEYKFYFPPVLFGITSLTSAMNKFKISYE